MMGRRRAAHLHMTTFTLNLDAKFMRSIKSTIRIASKNQLHKYELIAIDTHIAQTAICLSRARF